MSIERISQDRCDGCGICLDSCPNNVIRLDGERRAEIAYPTDCHTCFLCEWDCPRHAIYVSPEIPYLPTLIALARQFSVWCLLIIGPWLLMACSAASTPASVTGPPTLTPPPVTEGAEKTWEKSVGEARKEGKVVMYSTQAPEVREALTRGFRDRFGIDLEIVVGRSGELLEKINSQRRAGLYWADVVMPGTTPIGTTLKPQGILERIEPMLMLPEVTSASAWLNGKFPWWDRDRTAVSFGAYPQSLIAINTSMVKASEMTSYQDLLDPRWKGKILMDSPLTPGVGQGFALNVGWNVMNVDYLRQLARQEPVLMTDQRLEVEWLARGRYPILIAHKTANLAEFKEAGAPVEGITPKEGVPIVIGGGIVAAVNKAPHPNATRVFVNWLLSKEGLTVYSKAALVETARVDIPVDFLPSFNRRLPGVKYVYVTYESEEQFPFIDERLKAINEIFRPLLGK